MKADLIFLAVGALAAYGQIPAAPSLTGYVRSALEGPMEGVLVSAQRAGSSITVTVVSDAKGRYSFPRNRLERGQYSLRIRAAGYDAEDPGLIAVDPVKTASADLTLHKTTSLAAQLSNAEWIMSMPGGDDQKGFLLNCVNCHRLDLIAKSRHTSAEFLQVMERMGTYANQSTPLVPQKRLAQRLLEERGPQLQQSRQRNAEFLSKINLSSGPNWSYSLNTLPRPKGKATQVVVTEYDLPRRTIQPHDVILDSAGMVW